MMDLGIENSRFLRRPLLVCVSKSAFYIKFIFAHLRNRGEVKSPINCHRYRRVVSSARQLKNFYRNCPSGRKALLSMPRFLLLPLA